jgi:hypothetical protein
MAAHAIVGPPGNCRRAVNVSCSEGGSGGAPLLCASGFAARPDRPPAGPIGVLDASSCSVRARSRAFSARPAAWAANCRHRAAASGQPWAARLSSVSAMPCSVPARSAARSGRAAPAHATGPCQPAPPTAPPGVPGRHRARLAVLTARQHPRLTVDAATPQSPPSAAVAFYAPMVWSPAIASRQRRDHAGRSAPAPRCPPERPRPSRHRCCRC